MLADAPKLSKKEKKEAKPFESDDDLAKWLGI